MRPSTTSVPGVVRLWTARLSLCVGVCVCVCACVCVKEIATKPGVQATSELAYRKMV